MLEIRNVPTRLILYAVQQWLPCQKYAKDKAMSKNTNPFLKGISVWLILKNESTSGNIQNYRAQLPALAAKCKMSVRTLYSYLAWLKKEELIHTKDKALYLHDYKTLKQYGINITEREQTIYYDTNNDITLAEMLITIALQKYKERWMKMYWNKVNQNPDEYKALYDLFVFFKADATQLQNPDYFRQCHLKLLLDSYEEEKPGRSEILDFLHNYIKANPDLNARADTYAYKFNYNAAMSFCHLKFRLIKKGLITAEKCHIEAEYRARKDEKVFHHRWIKATQRTIWFRVDQLTINSEKIFAQNAAA